MTNEKYLEGIKKAEEKRIHDYNIDFDQLVCNEPNDETRKLKALEIIAEELIAHNGIFRCIITALKKKGGE